MINSQKIQAFQQAQLRQPIVVDKAGTEIRQRNAATTDIRQAYRFARFVNENSCEGIEVNLLPLKSLQPMQTTTKCQFLQSASSGAQYAQHGYGFKKADLSCERRDVFAVNGQRVHAVGAQNASGAFFLGRKARMCLGIERRYAIVVDRHQRVVVRGNQLRNALVHQQQSEQQHRSTLPVFFFFVVCVSWTFGR